MIGDLKPYPEYKDSGLPWLGEVPAHWEIKRNGSLFQQSNAVGEPDWPILEVSLRTGVRIRQFGLTKRKQVMSDKAKYKCATKGDFVYNMMRMWQGAAGIAPVDGLVSPAYVVAKPFPHVNPAYFASLFRTEDYLAVIDAFSRGIVKDRNRLYWDQFKQIPTPYPMPTEQAAIVRFLAWANGRLERAIRSKRKVIALLNEQKQAIIHRAVTRGLDPSVPLKASGVDWTPEIPTDWNQYPLRRLALCENSGSYGHEPSVELRELPVATTAQIDRDGRFDVGRMPRRGFASAEVDRFCCKPGDILVVKSSGSAANVISGKCGIVGPDTPPFVYSNFLARFVANASLIRPQYLFLLLTSYITRERVKRMVSTTTYPNLRMGEYRGALLPVPPLEEQERILEAVGAEVASVDQAMRRLEREITLLREYRTRLVADVVTGKLDVLAAAAALPDEDPLNDIAASPDPDDDALDPEQFTDVEGDA